MGTNSAAVCAVVTMLCSTKSRSCDLLMPACDARPLLTCGVQQIEQSLLTPGSIVLCKGLLVLKAGKAGLTCWTAKEQLMPAPFRVLPCSYSRRTDGPIPCTCHHIGHGCCSKLWSSKSYLEHGSPMLLQMLGVEISLTLVLMRSCRLIAAS